MPGAEGEAEVIALIEDSLDGAGLRRHRVGVGDGTLFARLLDEAGVPDDVRADLIALLSARDFVGLERRLETLGLSPAACERLVRIPSLRGGPEVLEEGGDATADLRELHQLLAEGGIADRVIFDLGLVRALSYYTGPVFEVYDPAVGFALGGGGRDHDLIGRVGRPLPACGIALDVGRVHLAQAAEERLA